MNLAAAPRSFVVAGMVALLVLAGSALALETIVDRLKLQLRKLPIQPESGLKFHTLPKTPRGWSSIRDDQLSAEAMAQLGTENYVARWYERTNDQGAPADPGVVLQVHAAYYTGMIDTVPHVPERCFIGGGMEYAGESRVVKIPLDLSRLVPDPDHDRSSGTPPLLTARNERLPVRVRLPRGVEDLSMKVTPYRDAGGKKTFWAGYCFLANGGVVASANDVRLLAFKLDDAYSYYAKVQFMSGDVDSADGLAALAGSLLDEILPDLMRCVPDWTDVEEGRWPRPEPSSARAPAAR
jgi:hypothetical protein